MKYAISGANGFIGKALQRHLKDETIIHIPRCLLYNQFVSPSHLCEKYRADFFNREQPDYIIHLAAYGNHYNQQDDTEIIEANVMGTWNMLNSSKDVNYKKFYNFSSSSITLPHETFYSASKLAGEKIANAFKEKYNKPVVNICPYSVYGPGEASFRFIPKIIHCLQTGEQMTVDENAVHDWIYIDDFITAMLAGETEIGTGEMHTNKEVIEILESISGNRLNYKPGTLRTFDTDNWVAKKGVQHISLYDGLKQTYEQITRPNN